MRSSEASAVSADRPDLVAFLTRFGGICIESGVKYPNLVSLFSLERFFLQMGNCVTLSGIIAIDLWNIEGEYPELFAWFEKVKKTLNSMRI